MGFDDHVSSNIVLAGIIRLRVVEHNNTQQKGRIVHLTREKTVMSCLSTRCDVEVDMLSNIRCDGVRRQGAAEHTSTTPLTTRVVEHTNATGLDD